MVTGPLRGVLWVLGGLAAVWLLFGLLSLPLMGRMMGGGMSNGGMMDGGMMGVGMGSGVMDMVPMMLATGAGVLALLGLVGVFIYLVVDWFRHRSVRPTL
jgi:hypothetical protein